jgi:TonB family protein
VSDRRRNLGPGKATWSLAFSLVAHVGGVLGVGWIAYQSLAAREAREAVSRTDAPKTVTAVELPSFDLGTLLADRDEIVEGALPEAHGGATIARIDTGTAGRGGTAAGPRATNLAAIDDAMSLSPDLLSRLDRDQEQRLRTTNVRTSHDDRRATTNPMELTFLASGSGERQERRPEAAVDPSRGSLSAPRASVRGGHPGTSDDDDEHASGASPGAQARGQLLASPGIGARDGTPGSDHRVAARVAKGRPDVAEANPTIPAIYNGRPNDTIDSDQEVASTVRSLVHASVAGGFGGFGRGGEAGPASDPGAGGASGRGSVARVLGAGDGDVFDWYTSDPALLPYFRKIHAKVDPLWANAFPRSALLELKQGTVILEFTIAADGTATVSWPPVRPSGIDEFDRNCADAIRRASPFEPIPASLREAGHASLRIRAPFEAKNPIIK